MIIAVWGADGYPEGLGLQDVEKAGRGGSENKET
jgi:hypothetical protein